jgi:hypothetical protein
MNQDPITSEDIKDWLDSQSDFSLEMRVLSQLKRLDFYAEHGGTYSDPVTGKPRQFDIRCLKRDGKYAIKLAIECKALTPQFPLVIQRVLRTEQESYHEVFFAHEPQGNIPGIFDDSDVLRTKFPSSLYPVNEFVGKSSTQIGKKDSKKGKQLFAKDSEIYDKWAQAISSMSDLVTESSEQREKLELSESLTVILPVLVVSDDSLWCVDYDSSGCRTSEPLHYDDIEFYIGKEIAGDDKICPSYIASHLKILTLTGFCKYTEMIVNDKLFWNKVFPPMSELEANL